MRWLKKLKALELRYEKIILLAAAVAIGALLILYNEQVEGLISASGNFGYIGVLVAGAFSSWGLTAIPGYAALFNLGSALNPWVVALMAAFSATVTDLVIFYVAKRELSDIVKKEERKYPKFSKWVHRFAPAIVALAIATPVPDEVAAGFMGALRWDEKHFIVLVYIAHFLGILAVAGAGSILV